MNDPFSTSNHPYPPVALSLLTSKIATAIINDDVNTSRFGDKRREI